MLDWLGTHSNFFILYESVLSINKKEKFFYIMALFTLSDSDYNHLFNIFGERETYALTL